MEPLSTALLASAVGAACAAAGAAIGSHRSTTAHAQSAADHQDADRRQGRYHEKMLQLDVWMRQLMMSAGNEQHFYDMATAGILDLVDADCAFVPVLDAPRQQWTIVAATGGEGERLCGDTLPTESAGAIGWVARQNEPLSIENIADSAVDIPLSIRGIGAQSLLLAPVSSAEVVDGILVAARDDGAFDDIDRQVLVVFAQKVAIAVENMRLVATLQREKERAEVTLHSIGDAVITTNAAGLIDYMNPVAEVLTGWSNLESIGATIDDVFHVINENTRERMENPVLRCLREGIVVSTPASCGLIRRDGKEFCINESAAPIRDAHGAVVGSVLVFSDCSATRAMARQLNWQATHDALTGLANRRQFEERVRHALKSARDNDLQHVLMYLDLDQFKVINDTSGHMAGDELLKQLSTMLRGSLRDMDTLARLGGDEFGVLLYACPPESGVRIADKLREVIRGFRFVWENTTFELGVSIGLVNMDAESDSVAGLLSATDMACHVAKERGRNRVHVYTTGDAEVAQRHGEMQWVAKITRALAEDRFILYAQSIVPTTGTDNIFDHVEILVRMIDEEGKIVPPGAFIPAAERYNLMGEIDRWVVRNVFKRFDGRLRHLAVDAPPVASINLSGASMSDQSLLRFIRAQFEQYDVPHHAICFEITETAAVQNLSNATEFINDLRDMGCRFALDDFGAGLSSFAYLKNLPVDYLKIDGGFVKGMLEDPMSRAIVAACSQIGRALGIGTIAEFVEDTALLEALAEMGVDYGQGYGIHKPESLDNILRATRPGLAAVAG